MQKQELRNKLKKLGDSGDGFGVIAFLLSDAIQKQLRQPDSDDPNAVKCPRCWVMHYCRQNFDGLCDDCQNIILEDYPNHWSAVGIKESLLRQREYYRIKLDSQR